MRLYLPIVFLSVATCVFADPSAQVEAFLAVPGSDPSFTDHASQIFVTKTLPKELVEILAGYDWGTPDSQPPSQLNGFLLDLNKDGKSEYFISTIYGGSGGPDYMILSQISGHWKVIGGFQGALHVMPATSGWPDLVTTSRGGGGNWAKIYQSFQGGEYIRKSIERYERGKITKEAIQTEQGAAANP